MDKNFWAYLHFAFCMDVKNIHLYLFIFQYDDEYKMNMIYIG